MPAIDLNLTTMSALSLSPREARAGREPKREVRWQNYAPPLPGPLLRYAEEREKNVMASFPERVATNLVFPSTLNPSASAECSGATAPKRSEGGQLSTN
jgi:hypothetical protein